MITPSAVTLAAICEDVVDCEHKTAPVQPTGYPSIRTPNIGRGRLLLDGVNRVSEETYAEWTRRATPQEGDLILAREAPVGNVAIVPPDLSVCLGQRTVLIRPDRSKVDPNYLLYLLLGHEVQGRIQSQATGATVGHLNVKDVRALALPPLPPLPLQRWIGSFLSAYDELIGNNTRRIAILEEMARALYREWFVNFRFPGHERAKFVDSVVGRVPLAWRVRPVPEVIAADPSTAVPRDGEKPFVPMAALSESGMLIDQSKVERRSGNSGAKFKNGDTLLARITPCLENGKTAYVSFLPGADAVGFGSTEFIVLRGKTVCPEYTYLLARSDAFRDHAIKSMSGATGRQRVKADCFERFFVAEPVQAVNTLFHEATEPLFSQVLVLARKNALLRQTRDLLLPKLISGELDVSRLAEAPAEAVS